MHGGRSENLEVSMLPKASIIIPVYNCEKYIRECVESALAQDYENVEVIVVDDGSTDATPKILKEFGDNIRYIRQENQGAAAAFNNGLRIAKGSLIAWLSADDVFMPHKIKYQVEEFQKDHSLALVYTDCIIIDAAGRELKEEHTYCPPPGRFVRELLTRFFVTSPTVLIRRECIEKIGYFDETLLAYVDADIQLRLLKYYRFAHIPIPLVKYRWHSANQSHNYKLLQESRDRVFLKVLEDFSPQEIFGDLLETKDVGAAYEWLALIFARQFTFQAASAAMRKAMREEFTLKRAVVLKLFELMSRRWILWALLPARQIRGRVKRWYLNKRIIRGTATGLEKGTTGSIKS